MDVFVPETSAAVGPGGLAIGSDGHLYVGYYGSNEIRNYVVAFAFITPIFFMNGGMNISMRLLRANAALFGIFMAVKPVTKFASVFPVSKLFGRQRTSSTDQAPGAGVE